MRYLLSIVTFSVTNRLMSKSKGKRKLKAKSKTKGEKGVKRRPGRIRRERPPHNATWLKGKLLVAGISQRDIAAELGSDFSTVSHLINGRRPLRDSDIDVIARMLKMPRAAFLAGVRAQNATALPESISAAVVAGEIEITGWVDGRLVVHEGKPKGPPMAPGLPEQAIVRVLRCQTQGSVFDGLDGALVYFHPSEGVEANAVGHMCVVKVRGGESLLRVVKKGYSADRFNLSMLNGVSGEEDAQLTSASPVIWLRM